MTRSIAIAGCGPCGLAAALLLARAGETVTLFERFENPRPVGSGLMIQPTGLAVLAELGLAERIVAHGARIDRLLGMAGRRPVLDVSYSALAEAGHFGIGIHRASLFDALFDAVKAEGVTIHTGRAIAGSRRVGSRRVLQFEFGEDSEPFDLVVDALGSRSSLAPPVGRELPYGALWCNVDWMDGTGLSADMLSQRYRRSNVMAGILPIGTAGGDRQRAALFWSLRGDRHAEWQAAGLPGWKCDILALWPEIAPFVEQINTPDQLTFARYSHRTLRCTGEPALIHIGDAWHSASPQLGQGANMALLDAWALARGLAQHEAIADATRHALGLRRRHVSLYQAFSWLFTPVYQSDSRMLPWFRDWLVAPLSRLRPANALQAAMVSGLVGKPLTPLGLAQQRTRNGGPAASSSTGTACQAAAPRI